MIDLPPCRWTTYSEVFFKLEATNLQLPSYAFSFKKWTGIAFINESMLCLSTSQKRMPCSDIRFSYKQIKWYYITVFGHLPLRTSWGFFFTKGLTTNIFRLVEGSLTNKIYFKPLIYPYFDFSNKILQPLYSNIDYFMNMHLLTWS